MPGAAGHRYLSHPVSDEDVLGFEIRTGIELPCEYSEFIRHVGTGMGPGGGLLPLLHVGVENSVEMHLNADWEKEITRLGRHATSDFLIPSFEDMTAAHVERYIERWRAARQGQQTGSLLPVMQSYRGGLLISEYHHVLIHKGELAGTVWCLSDSAFGGIEATPEGVVIEKPGGNVFFAPRPHTFHKWVSRWVDECIEEARMLWSGF